MRFVSAFYAVQSLSATFNPKTGDGISNIGRASSPELDAALQKAAKEEDPAARTALLSETLRIERREMLHIPLHELMIAWAMRSNVSAVHRPGNRLTMEWIKAGE